jgi:hypothetical protein
VNLKLRRLVRTPSSEQYALFDLDQTDANFDPLSIGKVDLHYASDGIYGTFLLWHGIVAHLPDEQVQALVESTLQELCEPMGMPIFYAVEFFSPKIESYRLHSNDGERQHSSDHGRQRFVE